MVSLDGVQESLGSSLVHLVERIPWRKQNQLELEDKRDIGCELFSVEHLPFLHCRH